MSKLLLSTILASGLLLAGGSAHAGDADYNKEAKTTQTEQQMNQDAQAAVTQGKEYRDFKGEVTDVNGDTVKIKDENGNVHTVNVTGYQDLQQLQAESIEEGDTVVVISRDGKPYAISKVAEGWMPDIDMPDFDANHEDAVRGKVTDVSGDEITFKDDQGIVHTADITGFENLEQLQAETIEEGDIVVVNMRDGKAYGISKAVEAWLVD